ncbi:adrenodoxin-like isoform X1 [Huso huso]|uniref:Adrenodoxin-like isoform X1 n=1 Tax=Huso huso TaxID=61971 RepID=A0ABR0Z5Y0_HUSHU
MARCVVRLQSLLCEPVLQQPYLLGSAVTRHLRRPLPWVASQHRDFHTTRGDFKEAAENSKITIHFINQDGERTTTTATEGESLLDVVVNKNLDFSGFGACEGTLACSTCHLIFDKNVFNKLEPLVDEELDMLDLAYGLTDTSRLGCQVFVQKGMDGMTVQVPQKVNDIRKAAESSWKQ